MRKNTLAVLDEHRNTTPGVGTPDPGLASWKGHRLVGGISIGEVLRASNKARRQVSKMSPRKRQGLAKKARASLVGRALPVWIHPLATKMVVTTLNHSISSLVIGNRGGAELSISLRKPVHFGDSRQCVWEVAYTLCDREQTITVHWRGLFTAEQVRRAFLTNLSKVPTRDLVDEGYFYRHGPWLSIPCKGTGERNSPVLGVLVTDEIVNAVEELLDSASKV